MTGSGSMPNNISHKDSIACVVGRPGSIAAVDIEGNCPAGRSEWRRELRPKMPMLAVALCSHFPLRRMAVRGDASPGRLPG